ncbi:MAG TPA: hypothetical protein VIJ93_13085 [bacterium]
MQALLPLILALSLQAASPATKPKNPVIQNSEAANKTGDSKQPSPLVPSSTPVSTPVSHPAVDNKKDEHQGESDNRAYRVKVISQPFDWLYLVYVIVTAIAAYVAWRALITIRKQGETMEGQIAEMKAAGKQTEKLIEAATTSADAAKRSADALVNIERPWIVVTIRDGINDRYRDNGDGTTDGKLYFEWFLTNHGKTAAFIYEVVAICEVKTIAEVDELRNISPEGKPTLRPDSFIVGPGQTHECPGITMVKYWTYAQRSAVVKRTEILVAHGLVKYRDMIDSTQTHQTPFIGVYVYGDTFEGGTFRRFYDAPGYRKYT